MDLKMSDEFVFPLTTYFQIKEQILAVRKEIEREHFVWSLTRKLKSEEHLHLLDCQFKTSFERLEDLPLNAPADQLKTVLQSLKEVTQQGASARLLGTHELGSYNVAMLIERIAMIKSSDSLLLVIEIIKITIIVDSNLREQKAYSGNGGYTSVEWLCIYLGRGIADHYLTQRNQFECCYTIFLWIIEKDYRTLPSSEIETPFTLFLANLISGLEVKEYQEKIILRMIALGISPISPNGAYRSVSFFTRIAEMDSRFLWILFPYENEHLTTYVQIVKRDVIGLLPDLINCCTSNNKKRKHFKNFFSLDQHWLLKFIIESAPEILFSLVKRNESELLYPFLKHFKREVIALSDSNGNTLLHIAMNSRGLVEKTVQLLLNAKLSPHRKNNIGLTPTDIAIKNNKSDIIGLLK
jgi:hypothetical protein